MERDFFGQNISHRKSLIFQFDIIYYEDKDKKGLHTRGETMKVMRYIFIFLLVLPLFFAIDTNAQQEDTKKIWSWIYYRTFSDQELESHHHKPHIFFEKDNVPLFNQLIFSWNAIRPDKGYFSFLVQVHNSKNNQWGSWHHMADWGAYVQRSFASKSDGAAHYNFVCLRMEDDQLADAFRIKVVSHEGADIALLKACSVSFSDSNNFKPELIDEQLTSLPSVHIKNVPTLSQFEIDHTNNDSLCSPTSCTMLTMFLAGKTIDPVDFDAKSYDSGLEVHGSWPFNMAHAFERCDGRYWFFTTRLNSFAGLHQRLMLGLPVVVSVRGPLETAALPYKNGHLLVVVGWNAKKQEVIVHDPAFKSSKEVLHRYPLKSFLEAWERSRRLTYLAEENQLKNER